MLRMILISIDHVGCMVIFENRGFEGFWVGVCRVGRVGGVLRGCRGVGWDFLGGCRGLAGNFLGGCRGLAGNFLGLRKRGFWPGSTDGPRKGGFRLEFF